MSRTAAIIRRLADAPSPPVDPYLVVQREAAERFSGVPFASETLPALLVQPWWQVEILRGLRPSDHVPPPRAVPVFLWLARRSRLLVTDSQSDLYLHFVTSVFGQGGSTVRQRLRRYFSARQISRLAWELRFESETSSSALTFDQWLGVFRYYSLSLYPRGRLRVRGSTGRSSRA